jgi:RNA polymerase sigma-70 factor (ECF subfamily)
MRETVDAVYRADSRRILATLIRLLGDFELAEEALHDAFVAALEQWQDDGVPANPRAWLVSTGRFKAIDRLRRRGRFDASLADLSRQLELQTNTIAASDMTTSAASGEIDDRLKLIFTCCHPALPPEAQVALTLREVCGLTTEDIARAFLTAPPTIAQRIVRAKRKIRDAAIPYEVPSREQLPERTDTALSVLYLIFNEGYSSVDERPDLAAEAIRLARLAVELMPESPETRGLLALMLLTNARRSARFTREGVFVPLEDQDRTLWDSVQIGEGLRILDEALAMHSPGPYQIQAAIAALHADAADPYATDWPQISLLYQSLLEWMPTPVVELNAAVALGLATNLERALEWIERIEAGAALSRYHWLPASKADVLRRLGRPDEAAAAYEAALALVTNPAERDYLRSRFNSCRR